MDQAEQTIPDLDELIDLFYASSDQLGKFEPVQADDMPGNYQKLLSHQQHMTVTLEKYHNSPVVLEVLGEKISDDRYWRKILLKRSSDNRIVQFGIVRLALDVLDDKVRTQIKNKVGPMGRILIENDVLRTVRLSQLWKITPGDELSDYFWPDPEPICFGRTAMIFCNEKPAIELLEIVAC